MVLDARARNRSVYGGGIVSAGQEEVGNRSGQQASRNGLRILGLQAAARKARTAFDGDPVTRLAHPVQGAGAIVGFERSKRPIGFGKHVDAAFGAYKNGEISGVSGGAGSALRRVQDGFGVLDEWTHTELIDPAGADFRKNISQGLTTAVLGLARKKPRYASGRRAGSPSGNRSLSRYRCPRTSADYGRPAETSCSRPAP